jgi:hypothetical protein
MSVKDKIEGVESSTRNIKSKKDVPICKVRINKIFFRNSDFFTTVMTKKVRHGIQSKKD